MIMIKKEEEEEKQSPHSIHLSNTTARRLRWRGASMDLSIGFRIVLLANKEGGGGMLED